MTTDAPLADAAGLMDEGVEHLVVVDREHPVDLIPTIDIAGTAACGRK